MKKYMIRCDIEGVSGVVSYEQAEPGKSEFTKGQAWFMSDLLALIHGLNDGGADEIHIYDEHYYGRNIDFEELPENVFLYCGKPPYQRNWAGGLDESFVGLILLGFHSKRGTENALLNHTYELDIRNILLNGVSVGEIGIEAAIAGDFGVPLVLITGDSQGVEEAKRLVPDVEGVTVKESLSDNGALCYPITLTAKWIYEKAKQIVEILPQIKPYQVGGKVCLEVELATGIFCDTFQKLYPDYVHGRTAVIYANSTTEAWAVYWDRKLKCYDDMRNSI